MEKIAIARIAQKATAREEREGRRSFGKTKW